MKYYLPKYIPIYKLGNLLCIGFANKEEKYYEFPFSDEIYNEIKNILLDGVDVEDNFETSFVVKILLSTNLLVPQKQQTHSNRGKLFLEYIDNLELNDDVLEFPILVFGAGAIGGTLTYLLAQFGFKNIAIADFDIVEESDILKTMVYDIESKGILKVDALANKVKNNFGITLKAFHFKDCDYKSINTLVEGFNPVFIVKACDPDLIFRVNLNKVCIEQNIPHIHIAYAFEELKIGPLYVPYAYGCDNCLNLNFQDMYGAKYAYETHESLFRDKLIHPSTSFNINTVSSIALKEILFFLTGKVEYCLSIGNLVTLNFLSLNTTFLRVEKNNKCLICNLNKSHEN